MRMYLLVEQYADYEQRSNAQSSANAEHWEENERFLCGYLKPQLPPQEVEVVLQTIALRGAEAEPALTGPDAAQQRVAWLMTVARHEVANFYRRRQRHSHSALDELAEEPEDDRRDSGNEEREALLAEQTRLLEELRGRDPVNHRLLVGHHMQGRRIEELADKEGLSVAAVWQRLDRARAWMHRRLSPYRDKLREELDFE